MSSTDTKLAHFEPVKETLAKYKDQIDAIRKSLTDGLEEKDDVMVYRFLRGYQFDVDAASAALLKTLKWRKEHKVDEIAAKIVKMTPENFPSFEKMQRVNPQNLHHGSDKKGQPIVYAKAGKSDPTLLTKTLTEEQLLENITYQMEYKRYVLSELTKEKGVVMRSLRIVDLTGLGRKHLAPRALRTLRGVIGLVQDHYPELVGNIVYVNVPWVFTSIWQLIKPWINPATLEKITITGRSNAQETLASLVDSKQLPKYLGGECECTDKGGCVPEPDPDAGFTKIVVGRSSAQEVVIEVPPASEKDKEVKDPYLVNWEFRTESNNIDFEVIWKPKTGSTEEVFKKERVDSHQKIIEGGFEAKAAGSVVFNFDNKFSWTYSKTVLYKIEVGLKEVKVESESTESTSSSSTSTTSTSTTTESTTATTTTTESTPTTTTTTTTESTPTTTTTESTTTSS